MDLLRSFALLVAMDKNKYDKLSLYLPFVITHIFDDIHMTIDSLCTDIYKNESTLQIPNTIVRKIIKRFEKYFHTERTPNSYTIILTEEGKEYKNNLKKNKDELEKDFQTLYENFPVYYHLKSGNSIEASDTKEIIEFIFSNHKFLTSNDLETYKSLSNSKVSDPIFLIFMNYIQDIQKEKEDNQLYNTLIKIFYGNILHKHLIFDKKFEVFNKNLKLYLDTNFVISLLGLDHHNFSTPAKQLLDLIRSEKNLSLYISDFTLNEITNLLSSIDLNPTILSVPYSIESMLRKQGICNNQDKGIFISDLKYKFEKMNILIENTNNFNDHPDFDNLYNMIQKHKTSNYRDEHKTPNSIHRAITHDTNCLLLVQSHINATSNTIINNRALFLTSSTQLYHLNTDICKTLQTRHCIILDSYLTEVLFLSNPKLNSSIPLDQFIKEYMPSIIVDIHLWKAFDSQASKILEDDKTEENIKDNIKAIRLNTDEINKYLYGKTEENINEDFVKDTVFAIVDEKKSISLFFKKHNDQLAITEKEKVNAERERDDEKKAKDDAQNELFLLKQKNEEDRKNDIKRTETDKKFNEFKKVLKRQKIYIIATTLTSFILFPIFMIFIKPYFDTIAPTWWGKFLSCTTYVLPLIPMIINSISLIKTKYIKALKKIFTNDNEKLIIFFNELENKNNVIEK